MSILSYIIIHHFPRAVKGYFVNEWRNEEKTDKKPSSSKTVCRIPPVGDMPTDSHDCWIVL